MVAPRYVDPHLPAVAATSSLTSPLGASAMPHTTGQAEARPGFHIGDPASSTGHRRCRCQRAPRLCDALGKVRLVDLVDREVSERLTEHVGDLAEGYGPYEIASPLSFEICIGVVQDAVAGKDRALLGLFPHLARELRDVVGDRFREPVGHACENRGVELHAARLDIHRLDRDVDHRAVEVGDEGQLGVDALVSDEASKVGGLAVDAA